MARLLVWTRNGDRFEHRLTGTVSIGRHPDQDIQILDVEISRRHAAISWADDSFWLQDLSSKNGTLLNGQSIYGPIRLVDGDEIQLGKSRAIFSDRLSMGIIMYDEEACRAQARVADRLSSYERAAVSNTSSDSVS